MKTKIHAAARLVPLVALLGCGPGATGGAEEPAHEAHAADAAETPSERIEIPAAVRDHLGMTFATVEARRVSATRRIPGVFEVVPLARQEYRMALPGRVELLVDHLERVEAGQALYRFESPAWPELQHEIIAGEQAIATARSEIAVGEARLAEARANLARVRERLDALARANVKKAELESEAREIEASIPRLEAELRLTETHVRNAERTRTHALHRAAIAAGLSEGELEAEVVVGGSRRPTYTTIDWITVRASAAGVVESLVATQGAFLEPPDVVLVVLDPARVRFRALAYQGDLPELAGITEALIVPPRAGSAPTEGIPADLRLGLEAHPQERMVVVLAEPRGSADWIRPGVSAFLEVVLDESAPWALAVPESCVLRDGLRSVVFRRDPKDPDVAIRVEADLGVGDGRWVVLESGVRLGDQVVLDGAYELQLAVSRRGGEAPTGGHVHADGTFHGDE